MRAWLKSPSPSHPPARPLARQSLKYTAAGQGAAGTSSGEHFPRRARRLGRHGDGRNTERRGGAFVFQFPREVM